MVYMFNFWKHFLYLLEILVLVINHRIDSSISFLVVLMTVFTIEPIRGGPPVPFSLSEKNCNCIRDARLKLPVCIRY